MTLIAFFLPVQVAKLFFVEWIVVVSTIVVVFVIDTANDIDPFFMIYLSFFLLFLLLL